MSKKDGLNLQSKTLKSNNSIIWNNNNINGNMNINNNYNSNMGTIKRSGSITFKKNDYNNNMINSPIITPTSQYYKQLKLGANGNKSKPKIKNISKNNFNTKADGSSLEMNQSKNYTNYLNKNLNSSYNTNSQINNKREKIMNMTKDIESELKKNNDIYKSLILSYNDKLKENNKYKNEFINFLNTYKKQFKSFNNELNSNKVELEELSKKNNALKKEIKDTEEIINFLEKTEEILQNNSLSKYKEEFLKEKEKNNQNEINMLNGELDKLNDIKNIGIKDLQSISKRNMKLKEQISKLENQIKKNKMNSNSNNNYDNISISSSITNERKIRNKKFILDSNKKYIKNNNDYYKQLINKENNKTKELLSQIYTALKTKKEEEEKKLKEKLDSDAIKTESKMGSGRKRIKNKTMDIEIEKNIEDDEEIKEVKKVKEIKEVKEVKEIKEIVITKNKKQIEEQINSNIGNESNSKKKINKDVAMSQTFYKNNPITITKVDNGEDVDNDEIGKERGIETEIEREKEGDQDTDKKDRKRKDKKKAKFKDEDIERATNEKSLKLKSNSDSKNKDKNKSYKAIDKDGSIFSKDKSKSKSKSKENSKFKDSEKSKEKSNEKSKNKSNEKSKDYEISILSDQSKKGKLFSHINQNSLSMDELSSIMSSSKTQKKLSQSQESIIDILTEPLKGSYLYTITNKGKLLSFNITLKKFAIIDSNMIEGWTSFIPNYLKNIEGSLLLNTLEGLFIITGTNHNVLYFYSQEKSLIAEIKSFSSCHKYGGLLLSPSPDNNLFAIGGDNENNEVELLSFDEDEVKKMPDLLSRRVNASYTFINSKLYAIYGEENNTIEFLNIKKLKNKWTKIDYKMADKKISRSKYINNIYGHVSLPVDDQILIVGGKNNKKMMVLDLDEKTIDITDMKIPFIDSVGEYLFDKEKFFNQTENEEKKDQDGKNIKELIGMDTAGNVHVFDFNFNYVVLLIKNQGKEPKATKEK